MTNPADLRGFESRKEDDDIIEECNAISSMIYGLISYLEEKIKSKVPGNIT